MTTELGYTCGMRLMRWIIVQASLLAVVLSISLGGFGMAQAHTAMALDAQMMDHSVHSGMDHSDHDMPAADHGPAHEGHSNCPMIACCHTGGMASLSVPAMGDVATCQHTASLKLHLTNAEPESAKKPPKYV